MSKQLKDCPFCGKSGDPQVICVTKQDPNYWVRCEKCRATTQVRRKESEAIEDWNKRD